MWKQVLRKEQSPRLSSVWTWMILPGGWQWRGTEKGEESNIPQPFNDVKSNQTPMENWEGNREKARFALRNLSSVKSPHEYFWLERAGIPLV